MSLHIAFKWQSIRTEKMLVGENELEVNLRRNRAWKEEKPEESDK